MITATIAGRITKDAQMRQAGSANVCSFGMASNKKIKGNDVTTFVDVSMFGTRGEKVVEHLTKGKFVVVYGELSTREHNGKTYIQLDAQGFEFGPRSSGGAGSSGSGKSSAPADEFDAPSGGDDSEIPF